MLITRLASAVSIFLLTIVNCSSSPICELTPEKREIIVSLLCGHNAAEPEYRFSGAGCFRRSLEKRLEDSAIQIISFRTCGDVEFADLMQKATINALKFLETFAPCATESVDVEEILKERTAFVEQKAAGLVCSSAMKNKLEQRKPAFEAMISQGNDTGLPKRLLDQLGIEIDEQGNLLDR